MEGWPGSIVGEVEDQPERSIVWTGPLENFPDVLETLADRGRLLGNGPDVVRAVRDPERLHREMSGAGWASPEVRLDPADVPGDGSWLVKPLRSSGGIGIRRVGRDSTAGQASGDVYYQRWVAGRRRSAVFLGSAANVELVGVTMALSGRAGTERFAYRGSVGPIDVDQEARQRLSGIGRTLVGVFGLRGLFGVDLIVDGEGRWWVIEINPRYTASVEVMELATGRALMAEHAIVCGLNYGVDGRVRAGRGLGCVGKRVIYARGRFGWPARFGLGGDREFAGWRVPRWADVPHVGTCFEVGDPVLTLMDWGEDAAECVRRLRRRERRWMNRLGGLYEQGAERVASTG